MTTEHVTLNGAGYQDAPCVSCYRVIRAGVPATAKQLGYGVNKAPTSKPVTASLKRIYAAVVENRSAEYDDHRAGDLRLLLARLLGRYLEIPAVDPAGIVMFNGSTEAISVACAFAARQGLQPVLPLPNYYAFDQSLGRCQAPESVYYSVEGQLSRAVGQRPIFLAEVLPNGVLGSLFTQPPLPEQPLSVGIVMVDMPFGLPAFGPADTLTALRARLHSVPRWMLSMTPSKDLSIPGLRVGLIATNDHRFVEYAAADRFERCYSVHAAVGLIAALHLGLLCLFSVKTAERPYAARALAAEFSACDAFFLEARGAARFCEDMEIARVAFTRNLKEIDSSGLFSPVRGATVPIAGYSTFRWLKRVFRSSAAYVSWINAMGRSGMKLNPNYLFGGSPDSWHLLYPDRYGIRLNLSVPADELRRNLKWLADAFAAD